MADPRGRGGGAGGPLPPFFGVVFSFYISEFYGQKIRVKRVRNLSLNAGKGHFRDSNFPKVSGGTYP